MHGSATTKGNIPLQDQHLALAILLELAVQRGTLRLAEHLHISLEGNLSPKATDMSLPLSFSSQLLSAVLLLLRLWESGTREMDNERSTQGTSAPLLPLLQRFQNIHGSKEEPVPEEEPEVKTV